MTRHSSQLHCIDVLYGSNAPQMASFPPPSIRQTRRRFSPPRWTPPSSSPINLNYRCPEIARRLFRYGPRSFCLRVMFFLASQLNANLADSSTSSQAIAGA